MNGTFFDRKTYQELLGKRVGSLKDGYRQNIAIVGDELVGKTSIVGHFLAGFYDPCTLPVYLEVRPETYAAFSRRFAAVLLYNFLLNSAIPLKEDLGFLLRRASSYIPRTAKKIDLILEAFEKRKKNPSIAEIFGLCDSLHEESGKFCVIILDEFHNLESLGVRNLYPDWSRLLIAQKTTLYVIISSMKFKARTILAKHLSLLFGNFEMVTVEPFDIMTSEEYLGHVTQGQPIPAEWKDFIVHFTGGSPFYLDVVVKSLARAPGDDIVNTLEDLLFEPSGLLHQRFTNYLKRFADSSKSQAYASILYCIAGGHNKMKEIAHRVGKTRKELTAYIATLLECDCLTRSADFFTINDRVFGFWLKFVHEQQMNSLTLDAKAQKDIFRGCIQTMIQEYLAQTKKSVIERTTEILHLFEDDAVQIEAKRVRLDRFR